MSTGIGSNPVDRRMRRRQTEDYLYRLKNVKPFLEITPPKEHQHLQLSVKKMQMQQERQAAIDRQNQVIVTQLMKIKQSPARVDNWNTQWKPSNDRLKSFRERKQRRIKLENEKQLERLRNIQPYYDTDKWEKDYKKHQYYLWLLDGGTKEYDEIEDEDEEGESDDEERDKLPPVDSPDGEKGGEKNVKKKKEEQVKLPPIDGKKRSKDGAKKKDEYPEHVVIMDAEDIHKAIGENDKEKILQILGRVSEKKKLDKLKQKYKELYDKDLMEEVKPKLDEEMQDILDCLGSGAEEDATKLHEAMKGLGTDEDILIEILCTRKNAELRDIRAAYSRKYENSLETDLKGDTSGDLETLLIELSKGQRDESTEVDKELAKEDAKDIMEAGVASWGTDEGKFIRIFTQRSRPQLGATFPEYKKLTNKDIAESIDDEMDGDLQKAFLTLVKCVRDPSGFHSDKLHKALEEGDTKTVARIILGKNKAQLDELTAAYKKAHKVELINEIDKKCNGDLKALILAKLGKGKEKKKQPAKPAEKQEKAKKEAPKEKPKSKAVATQDKKTDKNTAKNKEEEAALEKDADELRKAIEAEDKTKIVDILAKNCAEKTKLQKLQDKYKKKHNQDLLEAVKPILDEDVQEAVESLLMDSAAYDAKNLYNATKGLGTDEDMLIEVLCTRTNSQLKKINAAYSKMYGNTLESDLKGDTSGDLETILVELNKGQRDESTKVDKEMAKKDAKELQEAGVASWGTDEGKFIRIFTQRSRPQLGATFPEYKKLTSKDIADSIDAEMDGDLQKAFMTIIKCVRDPTSFRLNKLQTALKEGDTKAVAAVILTKDKAQLDELVAAYKKANKVELADEIDKKCEGDTKTLILAKLGRGKNKKQQQKPGAKQDTSKAKPKAGQDTKKNDKNSEENKGEAMEKDVDELRTAVDAGDKDKVVDILAKYCDEKSKLQQLKDKYKEKHSQYLLEALKPVLEEEQLQDAVDSLLMESSSYDAKVMYNAMKGLGTDEDVLMEVLCSRDNAELAKIKETYTESYGRSLEKDLKGDTSGHFEALLVELSKGRRDESSKVDKGLAKKDAEALMQASYLGTDEDKFVQVFTQRSFAHLKVVFQEYKKVCNQEMDECIEEEMSQDLEKGFLALVKYTRDPATFYASKLQKTLTDGDTDTARRVILTSTTAELADIVGAYKKLTTKDLIKDAEAKFSDNMKKLILPKLKKASQERKEKEKASSDPKNKKAATGGKQDGAAGKKADAKPAANRKPTQKKKSQLDDKQEYAALRDAIDANNKKMIKEIVCRNLEKKEDAKKLVEDYNSRYSKELFESLEEKLEEDLIETLAALSLSKAMYDARTLDQAMQGLFTKEIVLIEIFSTRTNAEIAAIRQAHKKKYRKELEQVIKDDTSGDFETLLVELCKGQRDESTAVNDDLAHKDAESLLEAGIKKWGTDEETFIEIFTSRSFPQLRAMLPEYKKWAKCEIEDTIDSEMSGDLRQGLQTLVKCIRDQNQFLADKLQVVLQDKSTPTVVRIILGENAIADIEKAYNATYKPKLAAEIESKCSNELKKVLLPKLKDTGPDKEPQKEEKPSSENPAQSKPEESKPEDSQPEVTTSDQSAEASEKPRGNDEGPGDQEEKKNEERPQLTIEKAEYHGTLKPADNFNAAEDAETLKKAMKGFGSDEEAIMAVLGARTNKQRQEIAAKFQQEYDKNLVDELKSELGGKFEDAIVALMSLPELFDASSLHEAMSGLGTDEAVLIEILCSRSSEEIQTIKSTFKQVHGKDLVEEIKSETSGDLQTTLVKLAEGKRSSSEKIDENLAYEDANKLLEAGEDKWGTDESVFVKILTTRSTTQLQATFEAYKHVAKKDIMDSVNDELTGDFHDTIEAIVRCTRNPPLFFAEALEKAFSGLSSDSKAVTRIVISRSEVDLTDIKSEFLKKTGKTLKTAIQDELKGDLEQLLLQIIGD